MRIPAAAPLVAAAFLASCTAALHQTSEIPVRGRVKLRVDAEEASFALKNAGEADVEIMVGAVSSTLAAGETRRFEIEAPIDIRILNPSGREVAILYEGTCSGGAGILLVEDE